ncbi:MAG: hypothetical protein ACON4T_04095 [Synechococcus sp.]
MILYLFFTSLLIPVNLWAAIQPHLHTAVSMRLLHSVSVLVLLPLLRSLCRDRRVVQPFLALLLTIFLLVMAVVNLQIAAQGMGVEFGWLDHLLLAVASLSVEGYYLLEARASVPFQLFPASNKESLVR